MDQLIDWDRRFLLWLNNFHAPWLDPVMLFITKTEVWIPMYLLLVYLIFRHFKKEGWFILAGVAITILIADRFTSGLMKPFFHRLRPSHDPQLTGLVHLVNGYKGGLYGFASSHAANTFATALLLWLVLRNVYSWIWVIFIWAALMSYTRIYLGVHYPGDILAGLLVGYLAAWAGYLVYQWLVRKFRAPTAPSA